MSDLGNSDEDIIQGKNGTVKKVGNYAWMVLTILFIGAFIGLLIPYNRRQSRNELPYDMWATKAFPINADMKIEALRWLTMLALWMLATSIGRLFLYRLPKFIFRDLQLSHLGSNNLDNNNNNKEDTDESNTSRLYCEIWRPWMASRPYLTAIISLGSAWILGSWLLFESTVNVQAVPLTFQGTLVTRAERIMLVFLLASIAIALVKYLMARITAGIHRKYLLKRVIISDRHAFLLAQVYMSSDITLSEALDTMTIEEVKDFILKAQPSLIVDNIFRTYVKNEDTVLKTIHLKETLKEDAEETISMFSPSNSSSSDISKEQLNTSIEAILKEISMLRGIVDANTQLAKRLESALLICAGFIVVLISLMVLHKDGYLFALQVITLITGFGYLTEDTLRRMFTCLFFALVQHPFDIGDIILLDGKRYEIRKVYWLSMEAVEQETNRLTDMAISQVASRNIYNLSRSAELS